MSKLILIISVLIYFGSFFLPNPSHKVIGFLIGIMVFMFWVKEENNENILEN